MWVIVLHFLLPVIPYISKKHYTDNFKPGKTEIILRYLFYLMVISFMAAVGIGILSGTDTSFWVKINGSLEFAVKFFCLDLGAAFVTAAAERLYRSEEKCIREESKTSRIDKTVEMAENKVFPLFLYLLAIVVICLNVALMFDNVVWGDEAFSINTAENSLYGIMQIMYFWENHPPLYYLWLKLFGELFGFSVPVCHLASLVPFMGGIVAAITVFRKRFGDMSTAFFVVVSGLGSACLQYNLEIRMYAIAYACLIGCFYCSYKVIATGKRSSWAGMVLWGLGAAYSHYYALVAAGGILFMTGVCVWLKYRGRTWIKGLLAIIVFLIAYAPWMVFLYHAIKNVSGNWWATEILGFGSALSMIAGAEGMDRVLLPLLLLLVVTIFTVDSGIFCIRKKEKESQVELHLPSVKGWSDQTYAMAVGLFTVAGTMVFGYLLCLVVGNVLIQRYLYPVSAVAICMIVIGSRRITELLRRKNGKIWLLKSAIWWEAVLVALVAVLIVLGMKNYSIYSERTRYEKERTDEVLEIIGNPEPEVQMVTNGVKHLGWTVLYHYYHDNEVINGDYRSATSDSYWYFNPVELPEQHREDLLQQGVTITSYGERQIAQYPFYLYHMEK